MAQASFVLGIVSLVAVAGSIPLALLISFPVLDIIVWSGLILAAIAVILGLRSRKDIKARVGFVIGLANLLSMAIFFLISHEMG